MSKTLKVSEAFYSIQGEGFTVGKPAYFLRLTDCNLLCGGKGTIKDKQLHDGAKWRCDSIEEWTTGAKHSFEDVIEMFGEKFFPDLREGKAHLVITGGEPLLQMYALEEFLEFVFLHAGGSSFIEIETNGTIKPSAVLQQWVSLWNVSPKLSNSGMGAKLRVNEKAIAALDSLTSIYKFVIFDEEDVKELLQSWSSTIIENRRVYLMPAADNQSELTRVSKWLIEVCKEYGFNFGTRLQISIYNQKTGV